MHDLINPLYYSGGPLVRSNELRWEKLRDDFPFTNHLVLSLIAPQSTFQTAVERIANNRNPLL